MRAKPLEPCQRPPLPLMIAPHLALSVLPLRWGLSDCHPQNGHCQEARPCPYRPFGGGSESPGPAFIAPTQQPLARKEPHG